MGEPIALQPEGAVRARGWRPRRLPSRTVVGLTLLATIAAAAIIGPMLSPYTFDGQELALLGQPASPSIHHWLGTDELGRDALTRLVYGGRISLAVGIGGAAIATLLGTLLGELAGYFGGWIDRGLMRFTDIMLSIPALPLVLVVAGFIHPSPALLVLLISGLIWTAPARLVRGQVRSLRTVDFVLAARAMGAGDGRILLRHILPNILNTVAVSTTISVGGAIMLESALSFLGFGVQPPTPSWGNLLNKAEPWLTSAPWLSVPPGIAILLTILAVNLVGDGLRRRATGR